jgi:hypothetical protein
MLWRAVAPTAQSGVPRKNRQVSESSARDILEDAGQEGYVRAKSSIWHQELLHPLGIIEDTL